MNNVIYLEDHRKEPTDLAAIVKRQYQVDADAVVEAMTIYHGIPHKVIVLNKGDGPEAA